MAVNLIPFDYKDSPYVSTTRNKITDVGSLFINLIGHNKDILINLNINYLFQKILKASKNIIDLDNIKDSKKKLFINFDCYIFNNILDVISVNITVLSKNENEKIYIFNRKNNSDLVHTIPVVNKLLQENYCGIGIFSSPNPILLKANMRFLESLNKPFNNREISIGSSYNVLLPNLLIDNIDEIFSNVLNTGEMYYCPDIKLRKNKYEEYCCSITVVPIKEKGISKYIVIFIEDLTHNYLSVKSKVFQNNLSESTFDTFMNATTQMMCIIRDSDEIIINANKEFIHFFSPKDKEIVGKALADTELDRELYLRLISDLRKTGELCDIEISRSAGTVLFSAFPIIIAEEKCTLFTCSGTNELNKIQSYLAHVNKELDKTFRMFSNLLDSIQDEFYAFDRNWNLVYTNSKFENDQKMSKEQLIGRNLWSLFPDLIGSFLHSKLLQALEEKIVLKFEYFSNYNRRWYESHVYPSQDLIAVLSHDISAKKEAEKNKALLAAIVEDSHDGIISLDLDGRILTWNHSCERIFGYTAEEIIGKYVTSLSLPNNIYEHSQVMNKIFTDGYAQLETLRQHKNGKLLNIFLSSSLIKDEKGVPFAISSVYQDITERKYMEIEIARLDRLNLIGELAAGISHEVRNPMTVIRGYIQLFLSKAEFSGYRNQLNTIIEELDRANSIITEFLTIGKNSNTNMQKHNLNSSISSLLPLIEAEALRQDKTIVTCLEDIPNLIMNKEEIRQLLLNLVRNGLEAMPNGKTLSIKTYVHNQQVFLEIKDQGHGISLEVYEKIGTPFFTTKEDGTGLGLAVCYGIASRHNASISIETSPSGTTFFVCFK